MMGRLLIITFAVYSCTAAPTTDLVVPENLDFTAFSKLAPTDFLQAVIKSGGTEADCRSFATTTISSISESVKSQGATWAAVDTGAGCASEGQEFVRVAQGKLQGKQGVLATKQDSAKAAREAKTAACTAAVDISVGLDTLTKATCYDYTTEPSFISTDAACHQATTASTQAAAAVDAAQTGVEDAQGEVDDAVAEAARLKSECLCRVKQEQAAAHSAVQKATASNAADWKQAHEVLCALDKTTPPCSVPACPTVTQPTLAAGVANADCTATCDNCQVVYDPDHSGNTETEHPWSATLKGKPNTYYTITYDVLNSDLGGDGERLDHVVVGGVTMPGCGGAGDNRPDYQCDFTPCASGGSQTVSADASGSIAVTATYSGNSMDCHCDQTNPVGNCKGETLNHASTHGWTPTKAALKFYLTEAAPPPTYVKGGCAQPDAAAGQQFYTAWQYTNMKHPQESKLEKWCKTECDKWDGCYGIMDFTGSRAFRFGSKSTLTTAGHGICHLQFQASDNAAAAAKWAASPLKPAGDCHNGSVGCWWFHPHAYADATCAIKNLKV